MAQTSITLALAFLAGLMLVQQLPVLPSPAALAVGGLVMALGVYKRYRVFGCFLAGMLLASVVATQRLAERLSPELEGLELSIQGIVSSLPEYDEKRVRFDLSVTDSPQPLPPLLRLSWYYPDQTVKAGQRWALTVKLKRPHGTFNPAGFDYERWLFMEGIGATGYVRPAPKPVLLGQVPAFSHPSMWRQAIADRLQAILPHNENLALIKALTIGDGSSISQKQWQVFRNTGTTHLIVISGSHIALVAGLVYFLMLKVWARVGVLRFSPQLVAAYSALLAGVFYAGLAGFSVPAQRAVIMLAVAMLAVILQRNSQPFHVLMLALLGVVLADPIAVLSAGFWLSFGAVAVIIYVSAGRLGKPGFWHEAWHINWVTSLGLTPLLLLFFQQISLVSPIANVLAVPVISLLVVPLALLAVLLMLLAPALAVPLFYGLDLSLQGLWWVLSRLSELPMAVVNQAAPAFWTLALAFPGLLLLLAPKGMPGRWLGLVLCLPVVFSSTQPMASGTYKMTLLDVGQGLSAVLQTAQHCLVFDTGGKFSAESDMGQSVLLPFLHAQGVQKIDQLIISHGDNDHIGGAVSLLQAIPADRVLTSVPQQLSQYAPVPCRAGQAWQWDQVNFTILSPEQPFASDNDNSCVLKIESAHGSVLLSADIEASAEAWLVAHYGNALKADVLVAPHHGSQTSSTWEFLQAVKPGYVLVPSGYRNQFGHPHQQVLERYGQIHANWLTSADSGAITINVAEPAVTVQGLRASTGKYWNNSPRHGANFNHNSE